MMSKLNTFMHKFAPPLAEKMEAKQASRQQFDRPAARPRRRALSAGRRRPRARTGANATDVTGGKKRRATRSTTRSERDGVSLQSRHHACMKYLLTTRSNRSTLPAAQSAVTPDAISTNQERAS